MGCVWFSVGALPFLALPWAIPFPPLSLFGCCRVFFGYLSAELVDPCEAFSMGLVTGCGLFYVLFVCERLLAYCRIFLFLRGCKVSGPCWITVSGVSDIV